MPADPDQLERFLVAQEGIYEQAFAELRREKKRTHWIWYVFPQADGLGSSPTARFYAIKSIAEAKAYLLHPVLGPRLIECAEALLAIQGKAVHHTFQRFSFQHFSFYLSPLFSAASEPDSVFSRIIDQYFHGNPDQKTLDLLEPLESTNRNCRGHP